MSVSASLDPVALGRGNFRRIAASGFGDGHNCYAHSCAWFGEHFYVGLSRYLLPLLAVKGSRTMQLDPFPVPRLRFDEMDLRGQIWRFAPLADRWDLAYRAPLIECDEQTLSLALSFRNMVVFQGASDVRPCLYTIPTQSHRVRRAMLRSEDGVHFDEVPQPVVDGEHTNWRSFRGLVAFNGRLYASPASSQTSFAAKQSGRQRHRAHGTPQNIAVGASVRSSHDPASGHWEMSSPPDLGDSTNCNIFDMAVCGDYLYLGTLNVREGFQLWRTKGEGPGPHHWEKVLDRGADRGPLNQAVQSFTAFKGDLYLGTAIQNGGHDKVNNIGPAGGEVIRVRPDGSWDLIVGEPRRTRQGFKIPLSGIGPGFGTPTNGYIWRMEVHDDVLYVGTGKMAAFWPFTDRGAWSETLQRILDERTLDRLLDTRGGAELWRTRDGVSWLPVTVNGFENPYNIGIRSLLSTPAGLFVGTANFFGPQIAKRHPTGWRYEENPRGGLEVWLGTTASQDLESELAATGDYEEEVTNAYARSTAGTTELCSDLLDNMLRITEDASDELQDLESALEPDPIARLAIEGDLVVPKGAVDADISAYFNNAIVQNVGYWHRPGLSPECAARSLIRELAEKLPTSSGASLLVAGANPHGTVFELAKHRSSSAITALELSGTNAARFQELGFAVPLARPRFNRIPRATGEFEGVCWVDGPLSTKTWLIREIRRVLKPGGTLVASDTLTDPTLSLGEVLARAKKKLRDAGWDQVELVDVTNLTWRPFFDHSRKYFVAKRLFNQLDRDRYQRVLESLPGGNRFVAAYVLVFARKET